MMVASGKINSKRLFELRAKECQVMVMWFADPGQPDDDGRRSVARASPVFNIVQADGYALPDELPSCRRSSAMTAPVRRLGHDLLSVAIRSAAASSRPMESC